MSAARKVSLSSKIKQVTGLANTVWVDMETTEFLEMVEDVTHDGLDTSSLEAAEVRRITQIFDEHFA